MKRRMYMLHSSRVAQDADGVHPLPDERWLQAFQMALCTKCKTLGQGWQQNPRGIHAECKAPFSLVSPITTISGYATIIREDLAKLLAPYSKRILWGRCDIRINGKLVPSGYLTAVTSREHALEVDRNKYSAHRSCEECGLILSKTSNPGAVVERTLGDDMVYQSIRDFVLIDGRLIESLELRRKFPELRYYSYAVIPEPLDGEVLPGDPSWGGVFRYTPSPFWDNLEDVAVESDLRRTVTNESEESENEAPDGAIKRARSHGAIMRRLPMTSLESFQRARESQERIDPSEPAVIELWNELWVALGDAWNLPQETPVRRCVSAMAEFTHAVLAEGLALGVCVNQPALVDAVIQNAIRIDVVKLAEILRCVQQILNDMQGKGQDAGKASTELVGPGALQVEMRALEGQLQAAGVHEAVMARCVAIVLESPAEFFR